MKRHNAQSLDPWNAAGQEGAGQQGHGEHLSFSVQGYNLDSQKARRHVRSMTI